LLVPRGTDEEKKQKPHKSCTLVRTLKAQTTTESIKVLTNSKNHERIKRTKIKDGTTGDMLTNDASQTSTEAGGLFRA